MQKKKELTYVDGTIDETNVISQKNTIYIYRTIFVSLSELIGAEGTWLLRERREAWDPTGASAEEAHVTPRGKQVPVAEINGQNFKNNIYSLIDKKSCLYKVWIRLGDNFFHVK